VWRASEVELFISSADLRPYHGWRNASGIGECGIGILGNSLELGCDCLGDIRYLDVDLADGNGEPHTIRQAICLHEEDVSLLWKHVDAALGTAGTRRSRIPLMPHRADNRQPAEVVT
jgi:primary-amine oxidase